MTRQVPPAGCLLPSDNLPPCSISVCYRGVHKSIHAWTASVHLDVREKKKLCHLNNARGARCILYKSRDRAKPWITALSTRSAKQRRVLLFRTFTFIKSEPYAEFRALVSSLIYCFVAALVPARSALCGFSRPDLFVTVSKISMFS